MMSENLRKALVDLKSRVFDELMDIADEQDELREKVLIEFTELFNAMVKTTLEE